MKIIHKISEIREITKNLNKQIGIVPTKGVLHLDHESLIKKKVNENEVIIISDFVNTVNYGIN